jgi:hypothetical protein
MGAQYAANWYADPTGRHELRYHDGTGWTEHVSDNGQHSIDPVEATAPVAIRAKLGRPAAATTVQGVSSDADELAKWAGLRDSGVISAEDFEAKKRQLLGL